MSSNSKFKVVRRVSMGLLKFAKGVPRYIFVTSPMYLGKQVDSKKAAATLLQGVDMETGEEGLVICPTVMRNELFEAYGRDGYVRKGFEIIVTRVADVKYNNVSVTEVAVPDDFEAPASGAVDDGAVATVYDAWSAEQRAKIAAAEVATPAAKPKR